MELTKDLSLKSIISFVATSVEHVSLAAANMKNRTVTIIVLIVLNVKFLFVVFKLIFQVYSREMCVKTNEAKNNGRSNRPALLSVTWTKQCCVEFQVPFEEVKLMLHKHLLHHLIQIVWAIHIVLCKKNFN